MSHRARQISVFAALSLLCAAGTPFSALAQLPVTRLNTLFPPGCKAGTNVDVAVAGIDLDEVTQIHFSNDGIVAKAKPEANKFTVNVGANVPPGVYEARVVGRFGISNPRAFVVGDLPELPEKPPNKSLATAMEVPLGCVINGSTDANAADYFKFTAKKGQRVLIDCADREIDSRLNAVLLLYDTSGHELDRQRVGSPLDLIAPADGAYIVKVHDFQFRGGAEYYYRLTISAGPHIDFIFPPAGMPGTKSKFTLYGRNLTGSTPAKEMTADGKPLEQLTVEIEIPGDAQAKQRLATSTLVRSSDVSIDGMEYRFKSPQGISNPVLIGFATAPVVLETGDNDKSKTAQKVTPPCEIAGTFYPRADQDWFQFDAKKGDVYWLEVISQRLGLPTDPFMLVQRVTKNEKGEEQLTDLKEAYESDANLGGSAFNTANRDPVYRFEVKDDGAYRVQVTDLFNTAEKNPALVYRLSIHKEAPDFRLVVIPRSPLQLKPDVRDVTVWTPFLRRGESVPLEVIAFREDGFGGDIDLNIEGLPAGVVAGNTRIPGGQNSTLLMLTAAESAPGWAGTVRVSGKAKIADKEIMHEARGGTLVWSAANLETEAVYSRMTRDVGMGVSSVEDAPITVVRSENKNLEAVAETKLDVPLKIIRRGEYNAGLKLKAVGVPGLDKLKELELDGKATNATLSLDLAANKLAPGTYTLVLQSQTTGKYRNDEAGAKAAEQAMKDAEKAAADMAAAAKKATEDASKATGEAKATADKAAKEAADRAKDAETKKTEAANRAKAATQKAQPRDVTFTVYSVPITFTVAAKPAPAK